jgi:hypothetical protein
VIVDARHPSAEHAAGLERLKLDGGLAARRTHDHARRLCAEAILPHRIFSFDLRTSNTREIPMRTSATATTNSIPLRQSIHIDSAPTVGRRIATIERDEQGASGSNDQRCGDFATGQRDSRTGRGARGNFATGMLTAPIAMTAGDFATGLRTRLGPARVRGDFATGQRTISSGA